MLCFDRKPASEKPRAEELRIYDLHLNIYFTLKVNPLARSDLDEFVENFNPMNRHARAATWSESKSGGRWRSFAYDGMPARDKINLDIFWLRDESLSETANSPDPDILATEIVED